MTEIQSQADLRKMIRERLVHHPGGCSRGRTPEWGLKTSENFAEVSCSHCKHVIAKYGVRASYAAPQHYRATPAVLHPGDRFRCPICRWQDDLFAYQRTDGLFDPGCDCWPNGVLISLTPGP